MATPPLTPPSPSLDDAVSPRQAIGVAAILHDNASGEEAPVVIAPLVPAAEPLVRSAVPGAPPLSADYALAHADRRAMTGWQGVLYDLFRTPISLWQSLHYKLSHLPKINYELARRLTDQGQVKDAILRYRITLWFDPALQLAWYHLGTCYLAVGDRQKAMASLAKSYALNPAHEETRFMIATIDPAVLPASKRVLAMPSSIALEYFEGMAPTYDASQTAMKYRGHVVAEMMLREYLDSGRRRLHILDLGCGTGLVGSLLGRYAERMVGVDISSRMLERAAERRGENHSRIYTDSFQRDLRDFLADNSDQFELITAVHVFNYLGDLETVFQHIAKAMMENGLFLFQTEQQKLAGDYALMAGNARFGHAEAYVESLIHRAGLEVVRKQQVDVYPAYPLWQWLVTKPAAVREPLPPVRTVGV